VNRQIISRGGCCCHVGISPRRTKSAGRCNCSGSGSRKTGRGRLHTLWSGQAAPLGRAMPTRTLTVAVAQEAL
jgi:hypothetical protein